MKDDFWRRKIFGRVIYEGLLSKNKKKTNHAIKKWARCLNKCLIRDDIQLSGEKICSPLHIISKVEIRTTVYLLEWPWSKSLLITTAGGDVENRKLPFVSYWDLKAYTDKPGKDMQDPSGKFQEQILLCTGCSEKAEL